MYECKVENDLGGLDYRSNSAPFVFLFGGALILCDVVSSVQKQKAPPYISFD